MATKIRVGPYKRKGKIVNRKGYWRAKRKVGKVIKVTKRRLVQTIGQDKSGHILYTKYRRQK